MQMISTNCLAMTIELLLLCKLRGTMSKPSLHPFVTLHLHPLFVLDCKLGGQHLVVRIALILRCKSQVSRNCSLKVRLIEVG